MATPAISNRVKGDTARSAIRVGLLALTVLVILVAWIVVATRTKVTVIVQAPLGSMFSVDGDVARPRLRPGSRPTGTSELHHLRLTPGRHEIGVREPTGVQHSHVLEVVERDRPLMLVVRNRELKESGAAPPP